VKIMSDSSARSRPASDPGWNSKRSHSSTHQAASCGRELFGEVLDLATGVGLLVFTLAPFALPALALVAVAGVLLMIPVLVGAILATPILLGRHWWRSHARASLVSQPAVRGRELPRAGVSNLGASGDRAEIVDTESLSLKARR
jgi:hypothetical protein